VLVVSLVCTLGVTAFAANIDEYTDADEVTYVEAVDVLTGVGILQGSDGTFKPNDNMTRAEAAKIIACLVLGADTADALVATVAPFDDVPVSHWASGYIAYCASAGIVNGTGSNEFTPDANVTAYEFGKMLLCAVGYGQNDEYVGATWAINVAADASSLGLYKNKVGTLSGNAAITRDEMALYTFNTLTKIAQVKYSSTMDTYYVGTSIMAGLSPNYFYQTIGYKTYDLDKTATSTDNFGRPVYSWTINGVVTTEDVVATPDYTYTGKVTDKALYSDISKAVLDAYDYSYYVDGVLASITPPTKTGTDAYQSCKVGSTTEVFIDETNEAVTVVTIYDYLGIVTDVDEDNSTIEVKFYYDYDATSDTVSSAYDTDVSATGFEEDDYVIVNLCQNSTADVDASNEPTGTYTAVVGDYNVESVAPATSLVGTVTAYANSSTTVDGTKYDRSNTCYFEITATGYDLDAGSYTFYLDSMGNILGSEVYEAASSALTYLYVSDSAASAYSAIDGAANVKAAVTYTDGTEEIVNLKVTDATKSTAYYSDPVNGNTTISTLANDGDDCIATGWYSYTVNSSGYYTLKALNNTTAYEASTVTIADNEKTVVTFANVATTYYATSNTQLVLVDEGKTYTGYTNFPEDTFPTGTSGSVLYITTAKNGTRLSAIYVIGEAVTSVDMTYAALKDYSYSTSDGDYYTFYVNGGTVDYLMNSSFTAPSKGTAGFIVVDSDGYADFYTGSKASGNTTYYVYTGDLYKVYSDSVAFINSADGKTYTLTETEDCEITRINSSNATSSGISSKDEYDSTSSTNPTVSVFTKGAITDGGEVIAIVVDYKN
ncbi:MAG: S-layer homology domain-containing protein, partial [Oscillospiraceae bacterium]|nr:S-layer homology domain-containing protein [Oscillospiraceae bacterium]